MDLERAMTVAASKLGYETLWAEQRLAIEAFVGGHDVFAALPTGFSKNLCFAILPVLFDILRNNMESTSIVLCISPLLSLMTDQKAKFSPRGLITEFVGGDQDDPTAHQAVVDGKCQIVYMTPESLFANPLW